MRDLSPFNFGLVVAYLVPGFVVLWGLSYHSETVRQWLTVTADQAPTVGDLLYATLASVAAGVIVSAVRWAVIETLHHHTGIPPPRWNFALLPERLEAFRMLVEDHYRYFQFYSNGLVALAFLYVARRTAVGASANQWGVGTRVSSPSASSCSAVPATPCAGTTAGQSNSLRTKRRGVRSMTNGSGPDHHDDRKSVERKEPKRTPRKQSASQTKKPAVAK